MDNKLKILNYLGKNKDSEFTMNTLSKNIQIPYATFYRTIQEMKELLNTKIVGRSTTISLNTNNHSIKSYLAISSEEEKNDFLKKKLLINKIASELKTKSVVLLFGSYAKGNEKESSDIDMMIINSDGKKEISFAKYELIFKKKINPIFITHGEFIKMIRDKEENVGKQALNGHIILNNPERFWEDVLHE